VWTFPSQCYYLHRITEQREVWTCTHTATILARLVGFEVLTALSMKMAVLWVAIIALMMEGARTSETLVNFYQTTRRYNPEDSLRDTFSLLLRIDFQFVNVTF
jgi:hypothetical protein